MCSTSNEYSTLMLRVDTFIMSRTCDCGERDVYVKIYLYIKRCFRQCKYRKSKLYLHLIYYYYYYYVSAENWITS
jgi:hypothetical protein